MTTATEQDLITQTVLDYFEGWYDGDVARMDRALHPELVKRTVRTDDVAEPTLGMVSKARMVELTGAGEGAQDAGDRRVDVTVVDVHDRIATVVVRTQVYREYLHLVRGPSGWQIAGALWQPADVGR
jgi:ketosteroid isomerase-like protein